MDIEGEEYQVLGSISRHTLDRIGQIVVEFHHYVVGGYTFADTRRIILWLKENGFAAYTIDFTNYLFYRRTLP
jgi:hypothetical protein